VQRPSNPTRPNDHRQLSHLFATYRQVICHGLRRTVGQRNPDTKRADFHRILFVGPCDSRQRQTNVALQNFSRANRHLFGRLLADDRNAGHSQQIEFHLAGVTDHATPKHVAGSGHGRESTRDETARHRLGDTESQIHLSKRIENDGLHVLLVDAKNYVADFFANFGLPDGEQFLGLGDRVRLGRQANLDALPSAGQKRQRRIADLL